MGKTGIRNGGSASQPSRRLAAIMFTDLVGYSALAHRDEALAIELLALHRGWIREILPRFNGKEIETVGDAFLIEFAGALAAVECARAIQDRFADHNATAPDARRMQLRIGIHVGDIEHQDGKVMGDGVNIASRIHQMAAPGGICVSEDVHHALRNRAGLAFESLGRPQLKNIASSMELFRIAPGAGPGQAAPPPRARRMPRWLPVGAAAAVMLAVAGGWYATRPTAPSGPPSVAVLPFDNLSAEADSAYFTDGLHDSVIGHLSRVSGLKVISRTSVMGYRDKRPKLRDVALELGVGHVVEGSVQRAGGRLRVAAQLIDTATDTHVWSNEYDRELADVFAVQADIAKSVASAVHAKLTPQEQASIDVVPTKNQAAYDLYLRAWLVSRSSEEDPERLREAVAWLDQAVALDPAFAQAYSLSAGVNDYLYWEGHDPSAERKRLVSHNAEMALKIDPHLAEAHVAKAIDLYHGPRSYELALRELEIARASAPGSADVHFWLAMIYRRQGRWDDVTSSLEQAMRLDPLNPQMLEEYAYTLRALRRYADAERAYTRLQHLDPNSIRARTEKAITHFLSRGDLAPWRQALQEIPVGSDPGCLGSLARYHLASFERRFADAATAIQACKQPHVGVSSTEQVPKEYFVAVSRWQAADRRAPAEAAKVRGLLEDSLAARPDQARVRLALALTLAMLGEHGAAVREADRAVAAMPVSRDALDGGEIQIFAVRVYASAGAEQRAMDEIEQSLRTPAGIHVQQLLSDPLFDRLRADPRFQKLIAEHSPDTASR